MRLCLPQPFELFDHTADQGLRARGATAGEALSRLVLALSALLSGGGPVAAELEERIAFEGGPGLAGTAVAVLREILYRFAERRLLPAAAEVLRLDERGAELTVAFGRWDPALHREGADVKAITWHAARLEREAEGWVAQVVVDV